MIINILLVFILIVTIVLLTLYIKNAISEMNNCCVQPNEQFTQNAVCANMEQAGKQVGQVEQVKQDKQDGGEVGEETDILELYKNKQPLIRSYITDPILEGNNLLDFITFGKPQDIGKLPMVDKTDGDPKPMGFIFESEIQK